MEEQVKYLIKREDGDYFYYLSGNSTSATSNRNGAVEFNTYEQAETVRQFISTLNSKYANAYIVSISVVEKCCGRINENQ